jgi:hypothetical protein
VIATELILGATIGGPEEEGLKLRGVGLNMEGDADEAASVLWGAEARKSRESCVD